jgi:hypothetical protein
MCIDEAWHQDMIGQVDALFGAAVTDVARRDDTGDAFVVHNKGVISENLSAGSNGYHVSGLNDEVGFGLVSRVQCSNLPVF